MAQIKTAPPSGAGAPEVVQISREEFSAAVKEALADYSRYDTQVKIVGVDAELISSDAWRRVLSRKGESPSQDS